MEKKVDKKKIILTILLLIVAVISIFVISNIASSEKFHSKAIKSLDDKKMTITGLTAATTGASLALAAVPSDITTPLANQIMDLSSYLLIVIGAIFLEKILLTLTGYVTFTFLIPIACVLYIVYLYVEKDILKNLAIKLAIFGIVIFMVIPVSVKISNLIEKNYETSINNTVEDAEEMGAEIEDAEAKEKEEGLWGTITSKAGDAISTIGDGVSGIVKKGKQALSNLIDAIAILLITTCVIPIAVLLFIVWIIKIIFGVNIPIKKIKIGSNTKNIQTERMP